MDCSRHALIGLFGHCSEAKTHFTVSNPKHGFKYLKSSKPRRNVGKIIHVNYFHNIYTVYPAVTVLELFKPQLWVSNSKFWRPKGGKTLACWAMFYDQFISAAFTWNLNCYLLKNKSHFLPFNSWTLYWKTYCCDSIWYIWFKVLDNIWWWQISFHTNSKFYLLEK